MTIGMMGTALISPLYGLYKADWGLSASDITLTYVIYMMGALFSLLVLGRLPDKLGYQRLLAFSIALAMLGTVLSMLASNLPTLFLGRFLVGVASSVSTSAGAAALRDQMPIEHRAKVPLLFSLLIAIGFGIGPLVGGIIGQSAAHPLFVAYIPTLVCGVLALIGLFAFVREDRSQVVQQKLSLDDLVPRMTMPQRDLRRRFLLACGSPLMAFSVFGFYAAMTPLFIDAILHLKGPLISGISIVAIFIASAATQLSVQRIASERVVWVGFCALALSCAALIVNLSLNSSLIFACGVLLTSVGHGCSLLGSMQQLNHIASPSNRSGLTSTYMVIGYAGSIIASLGIGWLTDHSGVDTAVYIFGAAVISLCTNFLAANAKKA